MKASELRPGQWFEWNGERCLFIGIDTGSVGKVFYNYAHWEDDMLSQNHESDDFEVTPLSVHGWDDEPQSENEWKPGINDLIADQSLWSQATFGDDCDRGPMGALKHLEKEARECQNAPNDIEEYADCLLLLLDATRRAGWTFEQLVDAGVAKMAKNKQRQWPKPTSDEPVEHVKPAPLQLREGAWYRRRDGEIVGPLRNRNPEDIGCYFYPFVIGKTYYTIDGETHNKPEWNLAAEVPPVAYNQSIRGLGAMDGTPPRPDVQKPKPDADGWIRACGVEVVTR